MVIMTTHVGTPVSDSFLANPQMWMNMNGLVGNGVQTWGFIEVAKLGFWVRCRRGITLSEFHYQWEAATSLLEATKGLRLAKV
ncbi:unnamed protein product [Sordaria macrospora k-hell]|uniref:WGS project CABT00000000 data, contig 2.55 n=2 Tax=Sordaria macrospora TaxID=5147 RepID=F7W9W2_SORMK|nr:uncharacterized protein SMAC_09412 [Sordaria macrospora k-hell]KAH7625179.1 hypothetical protein B0T09DRAFT_274531 [Sordaria sp. MPI-SDFR-AT-0083]CCC05229.1 unnamed protein product [Sordaria macrospora k-hell]